MDKAAADAIEEVRVAKEAQMRFQWEISQKSFETWMDKILKKEYRYKEIYSNIHTKYSIIDKIII